MRIALQITLMTSQLQRKKTGFELTKDSCKEKRLGMSLPKTRSRKQKIEEKENKVAVLVPHLPLHPKRSMKSWQRGLFPGILAKQLPGLLTILRHGA